MLKLCGGTKVKVFFLVLVYIFNFDLDEISATILEKVLLDSTRHFARPVAVYFVEKGRRTLADVLSQNCKFFCRGQ